MKNKFEKIVQNLENLEKHYVLSRGDGYVIMTTKLNIVRKLTYINLCMRSEGEQEIEPSIYFLIKVNDDSSDKVDFFLKHKIPILSMENFEKYYPEVFGREEIEMNNKETEKYLDFFVNKEFLQGKGMQATAV